MTSIDTILQSLPSREDLIHAIGLERRSSTPELIPALSLFGTGMLFGAGLALLFAPRSGQEMRRSLGESMQQYTGFGEGEEDEERGYGSGRRMSQSYGGTSGYGSSGQGSGTGQMQGRTEQQRTEEREKTQGTTGIRNI